MSVFVLECATLACYYNQSDTVKITFHGKRNCSSWRSKYVRPVGLCVRVGNDADVMFSMKRGTAAVVLVAVNTT